MSLLKIQITPTLILAILYIHEMSWISKSINGQSRAGIDIGESLEMRVELARNIAAYVLAPGEHGTAIPGLTLYRLTALTACYAAEYEIGMAVIVQRRNV